MEQVKKLEEGLDPEVRRAVVGLLDDVLPARYRRLVPVVVLGAFAAGLLLAIVHLLFLGTLNSTAFCPIAWNVSCAL